MTTQDSLTINLTTVTPIWTGGIEGKADRLHATGIMGSLRWWYEVLVRGLGGNACDPSEHTCLYNKDTPPHYDLCDVCRVFGATGWSRRFRLAVTDETQLQPVGQWDRRVTASRSYKDRSGRDRTPTWFFDNPPRAGSANITITAIDRRFQAEIVGGLIQFLADWASIGARPQMGFGLVRTTTRHDTHYLLTYLQSSITGSKTYRDLPSLQNIFFASISEDRLPRNETFNLKYDLRRLFAANADLRHFVMGTVQREREGAKIMMSRPYNKDSTIRVWGWIPDEISKFRTTREQIIKQIHTHLKTHYTLNYWREFNSQRDTQQQYTDPEEFLKSLLEGQHDS